MEIHFSSNFNFLYVLPLKFCHLYIWHDQGKWVTCRKFQFQFSYTTFSKLQNTSFWCKPHYNWISGYRVSYEGFDTAKSNITQRNLNTVFANISRTTSPTSDSFLLIMSHYLHFYECSRFSKWYPWIQNQHLSQKFKEKTYWMGLCKTYLKEVCNVPITSVLVDL